MVEGLGGVRARMAFTREELELVKAALDCYAQAVVATARDIEDQELVRTLSAIGDRVQTARSRPWYAFGKGEA